MRWILVGIVLGWAAMVQADYRDHPEAVSLREQLVGEQGFERAEVDRWLAAAERQGSILEAIARPAERTRSWAEYRPIFVQQRRIKRGLAFWREHRKALQRAQDEYGVPAPIVVAIIGVETHYGRTTGSYRVLDALATLAFDYPPRADFFRRELVHYFQLMREQGQNPEAFKGSYAGAMGYGQFMPSSYRSYAVDFDGDGFADIWNNPVDAIGSVANYLAQHGWQRGAPVAVRARPLREPDDEAIRWNRLEPPERSLAQWHKLGLMPIYALAEDRPANALRLAGEHGEEYWLVFENFYVITRYNHSHLYALAVEHLARALKREEATR